jgi:flavin reductase
MMPPEPANVPDANRLAPVASVSAHVSPEEFRAALGRFATGVTVVTAVADSVDHAMTASAFASVSLRPPLVLVCVAHRARFHEAISAAGAWGVSILPASATGTAAWFATRGRPLDAQLEGFPHVPGPHTGAALLSDSLATVECRTWATYPGGDHTIIVGEVLAARVRHQAAEPLLHFHGQYRILRPPA